MYINFIFILSVSSTCKHDLFYSATIPFQPSIYHSQIINYRLHSNILFELNEPGYNLFQIFTQGLFERLNLTNNGSTACLVMLT